MDCRYYSIREKKSGHNQILFMFLCYKYPKDLFNFVKKKNVCSYIFEGFFFLLLLDVTNVNWKLYFLAPIFNSLLFNRTIKLKNYQTWSNFIIWFCCNFDLQCVSPIYWKKYCQSSLYILRSKTLFTFSGQFIVIPFIMSQVLPRDLIFFLYRYCVRR